MKPDSKKTISRQSNTVDRISELPDFIIFHILSLLGTREAYRTSILSRRWGHISATNPILEFHYYCKAENSFARPLAYWPSEKVSARLLGYMDTRMQRYDQGELPVTALKLRFPNCREMLVRDVEELSFTVEEIELSRIKEKLSCKFDEWIRIAVRNQIEILDLVGPSNYQLPEILLSAVSLRQLDCIGVKIPYYSGAITLASLQTLALIHVDVEERMLNHIIKSSLSLKRLLVKRCFGLKTIVIPCCSQLKELFLTETLSENGKIILETSSLEDFLFSGWKFDDRWPVMSKPGLLTNLRELDISCHGITDKDLGILLSELASLESLLLYECYTLTTIRISSIRLKKIYLTDCSDLVDVTIDAPSFVKFKYKGNIDPNLTITVSTQASCDIFVETTPDNLDTRGFIRLKELMTELSSCNVLKISLPDDYSNQSEFGDIEFDEEELGDVNLGPAVDITELKLTLRDWKLSRSSGLNLLNGLFWTCHPRIISFRVHLKHPGLMIKLLMIELQKMAKFWRHPLKRVEVESANCSNLLKSSKFDVQLRLHW